MPPRCTLCASPRRDEIDAALVEGRDSFRNIAERFGTSAQTVLRHKAHVPERLALARRDAEVRTAETLAEKVRRLEEDARRLLAKAEKEGDYRCAIAAVKALLDVVTLLHKVAEERKVEAQDLLKSSAWVTVRETIVGCLTPYPDALEALGRAMAGLEAADRDEERPRPDPAGVALRAANLLASVLGQNPEALEDDPPAAT